MSAASLKSEPEFVIYFFEKDENSKGSPVWQTYGRVSNEREAFRKADALYLSSKFTRVEVRRKSIDAQGRVIDEAVKILGSGESRAKRAAWLLSGAVTCMVIAGFVTFFG